MWRRRWEKPDRRRRRAPRWLVASVLVVLAVLLLAVGGWLWQVRQGRAALRDELKQWRAIGGQASLVEMLPPEPTEPAQNAAYWYARAGQRLPMLSPRQAVAVSDPWLDRAHPALPQAVAASRPALREVRRGVAQARCRWPIAYRLNTQASRAHLGDVQQLSKLLIAEAVLRAPGAPEAAAESLAAALSLSRDLLADPELISHEVQLGIQDKVLRALKAALAERPTATPQLMQVLEQCQPRAEFCRALMAGGAMWLSELDAHADRPVLMQMALDSQTNTTTAAYLRTIRELTAYFAQPYHDRPTTPAISPPPRWAYTLQRIMGNLEDRNRTLARDEARLVMARLALRLQAHHQQHGRYPPDLDALGKTPRNPLNNQPIEYRRLERGFVLLARDEQGGERWRWGERGEAEPAFAPTAGLPNMGP